MFTIEQLFGIFSICALSFQVVVTDSIFDAINNIIHIIYNRLLSARLNLEFFVCVFDFFVLQWWTLINIERATSIWSWTYHLDPATFSVKTILKSPKYITYLFSISLDSLYHSDNN